MDNLNTDNCKIRTKKKRKPQVYLVKKCNGKAKAGMWLCLKDEIRIITGSKKDAWHLFREGFDGSYSFRTVTNVEARLIALRGKILQGERVFARVEPNVEILLKIRG